MAFCLFSIDKTSTTGLVKSITQPGGNFTYEYDDNGNITWVKQDDVETTYTYDALGQLIRVNDQNDTTSGEGGTTWVYEYDQGGNILFKKRYGYTEPKDEITDSTKVLETVAFSYTNTEWKDQLTKVGDKTITYDNIGNPESDGTWTYTWEKGRQLKSMSKTGTAASFMYNENGLRIQKTVNGVVTDYTLHGKNIVHLTRGSDNLHFFYDASNKPAIVEFNGTKYAYVHNLQGDIVAILDSSKKVVVSYVYDAWGRPIKKEGSLASTLGTVQPFRYRGYVFDEETGLYYLKSRYYSHCTGRFGNPDTGLTQSFYFRDNLYNYTNNNPVNSTDGNGCGNNPLPWRSDVPFEHKVVEKDGPFNTKYERWYNRYRLPVHERHWTDHNKPKTHSNPHDHHYDTSDPSIPPTNKDRRLINYPDNKVPDKWDGEDEWNEEKKKYEEETSENEQPEESHIAEAAFGSLLCVGGGYLIYQGIKWFIAWGAAVPTGGGSLVLLAVP